MGWWIAQMIRFDALITTQKTPALCVVPFSKKSRKIAENANFSKITIFFAVFLDFFKKQDLAESWVFVHCNPCINTLHLSYQTTTNSNFNFFANKGLLPFFRPLVAGGKRKIVIQKKIFSVFLQHKAYKTTRARKSLEQFPPYLDQCGQYHRCHADKKNLIRGF